MENIKSVALQWAGQYEGRQTKVQVYSFQWKKEYSQVFPMVGTRWTIFTILQTRI